MNHMAEVAKLLGVKLGEEFEVGLCRVSYILTEEGLFSVNTKNEAASMLTYILNGTAAIHRGPWKPNKGDGYWTVMNDGSVHYATWYGDIIDVNCYKLGNCYRTNKEAEANRNKWISFYASDEVLEV